MKYFVTQESIVRKIWGNTDVILFIFAGAAAEFSVNKAVDWLYFTGKLPNDPLGRLLSTVTYAQKIVFSNEAEANLAIDQITAIHKHVEAARQREIPDWAYRDVLFMLINYSIRSFELLERALTAAEKEEVFQVFLKVGIRMKINGLPVNYEDWKIMHLGHLNENLMYGNFSKDLYTQYKKHLGSLRYNLMIKVQGILVPDQVKDQLNLSRAYLGKVIIYLYKASRFIKLNPIFRYLVLPDGYRKQLMCLATT